MVASQNRLVGVYREQEELCLKRKENFKSPCKQSLFHFTVPLKSKLPVASCFLHNAILVAHDENRVARESLNRKFLA